MDTHLRRTLSIIDPVIDLVTEDEGFYNVVLRLAQMFL